MHGRFGTWLTRARCPSAWHGESRSKRAALALYLPLSGARSDVLATRRLSVRAAAFGRARGFLWPGHPRGEVQPAAKPAIAEVKPGLRSKARS